MNEQYFFVRKLGLGKEVMSLSLVVTEVSLAGGMRWWRQEVGLQISRKKGSWKVITSSLQWFEFWATNRMLPRVKLKIIWIAWVSQLHRDYSNSQGGFMSQMPFLAPSAETHWVSPFLHPLRLLKRIGGSPTSVPAGGSNTNDINIARYAVNRGGSCSYIFTEV